jgi:UDP:flavonoid glycosyltransferase YjiC (YdhE family)
LGVGPKSILRHHLTTDILTQRIQTMLSDTRMQTRAADLGECIRQEDGVKTAVDWVQEYIATLPQKAKS